MNEHYHLIGIGGIGMSAVARLLLAQGYRVTGSDLQQTSLVKALRKEGAEIFLEQKRENVSAGASVVYSTDIKENNPELEEARRLNLKLRHRSEILHEQMAKKSSALCVTGTHGKTTTSSLLAHVLYSSGRDPSFALGGILQNVEKNAYWGKGEDFVAEADESDGSFLAYRPYGAIITNIDNDHMNHWLSFERLVAGFAAFARNVISSRHLLWCQDDPTLASLGLLGTSYGFSPGSDAYIENYRSAQWSSYIDLLWEGTIFKEIHIPLIGRHNVLNAAAVFTLCLQLGVAEEKIRKGIESFRGVKRRAEWKGEWNGIAIYDDYGHHPTEVLATLKAFRQAIPGRRLIIVFQPHRYSRLSECLKGFALSFDPADEIILTDVYSAGEAPIEGISTQALIQEIAKAQKRAPHYSPREKLIDFLKSFAQPGDVVVTMGAGDITKVGPELIEKWHGER